MKPAMHPGAPSSPECSLSVAPFHPLSSSDCSPPLSASMGSPSQTWVPSPVPDFPSVWFRWSFCTLTTYDDDCICIGLASKFHWFLSKNKRHNFHCHQELYWTVYSQFCSTTFCHFFQAASNSIFPKLFIFLSKELLQMSFMVFQGIEIFPLREFCKDQNKWKSEGAMSGDCGGWIRTSQPSCNSFLPDHQRNVVLSYPDARLSIFSWLIPDAFCLVLPSVCLIGSKYLLELIIWFSRRSLL